MAAGEATREAHEALVQRVENLGILVDASRAMASERDPDALLIRIIGLTSTALRADRSTLFLLDRERNQLWSKVAQGDGLTEIRVPVGAGIAGHVAQSGETVNLVDAYDD